MKARQGNNVSSLGINDVAFTLTQEIWMCDFSVLCLTFSGDSTKRWSPLRALGVPLFETHTPFVKSLSGVRRNLSTAVKPENSEPIVFDPSRVEPAKGKMVIERGHSNSTMDPVVARNLHAPYYRRFPLREGAEDLGVLKAPCS